MITFSLVISDFTKLLALSDGNMHGPICGNSSKITANHALIVTDPSLLGINHTEC